MEITINLPENVYANLSNAASKSHRGVDEIIVEKVERDFAIDVDDLEKQIALCSNKEVMELANLKIPSKQDARLSTLLRKQNEKDLTKAEKNELWKLMELNRLTTLKKTFALREISRRGPNGENK